MDEAGMADSGRLSRLTQATAERESKLVLAGDAAQLSSIGAGGLFKELEGKVPTAELTEVHRANHEWERQAWEQIRAGEPGPALAQYKAHDRLHIHDTRAQAAEAMVENWDQARRGSPDGQAVMITDASNKERDQINAMAQERRTEAGELGTHRVPLPEKPYGLASGDEIIFTAQHHIPGQKRVENGITGTITHTSRDEDQVTIKTNERQPRDIDVNTGEFSYLSLAYAVHVHKGQGLTTETSGILTGGWQTDREHTYVAVSRAREQTQIYLAREDLGEQGLDTDAIERLADRMRQSGAQEATITRETVQPTPERTPEIAPADVTQSRQQEIQEVIEAQRQRQLNWETNTSTNRENRIITTPEQSEQIERRADFMRREGADEITIIKQIAQEDTDPDTKWTHTNQDKQRYEQEIGEIVKQQRQRQLDQQQQQIDRDRENDRGYGIE
jgi:hypothetical protein